MRIMVVFTAMLKLLKNVILIMCISLAITLRKQIVQQIITMMKKEGYFHSVNNQEIGLIFTNIRKILFISTIMTDHTPNMKFAEMKVHHTHLKLYTTP